MQRESFVQDELFAITRYGALSQAKRATSTSLILRVWMSEAIRIRSPDFSRVVMRGG
jgi:hypothetical protein